MRQIVKEREPRSLTKHRGAAHADYENYVEKDDLRAALVREQGGLCCYCMSRIDPARMKIEHWAAQKSHPERQLDYRNLLAACKGGEGQPYALQHCDTHKGDEDLTVNPADPQRPCERQIVYRADGEIDSDQPEVRRDLHEVLNLNTWRLRENRKMAVLGMQESIRRQYPGGWPRALIEREIQRWRARDDAGAYRPYGQAVVFWLEKRLAREAQGGERK
jgi:uncharacterized protein (TIGR02646 family)